MYKHKKDEQKRYAKELSQKVLNIPPKLEHKMVNEKDFENVDLTQVLKDLESFLNVDMSNFQNYERWLEDDFEPNQKR